MLFFEMYYFCIHQILFLLPFQNASIKEKFDFHLGLKTKDEGLFFRSNLFLQSWKSFNH